jgi:hypothetical protein
MPFAELVETQILPVGEGEPGGGAAIDQSTIYYEDGLNVGRFAQLLTIDGNETLSNLDGTLTPKLAGVVSRTPVNPVSFGSTVGEAFNGAFRTEPNQTYRRQGLITVRLLTGAPEPTEYAAVYTLNSPDLVIGLENGNVTPDAAAPSVEATTAQFIRKVQDGVWMINIK